MIDVVTGAAHPLRADEVVGEPAFAETTRVAITGDGRTAGLLSSGSVLHAFDLSTGTIRWRRHGNRRWDRLAASPCGRYFAAGGPADTDRPFVLTVFDAATGAQLLTADYRTIGTTSEVHSLTFHPDGWLAAGFGDGSVRHFTLAGQMVAYPVHNAAVRALAFTADGATLLAGGTAAGARAVRLDAATKPAPPPAADRAALVRAFAFDDDPVPSTDPCDIIEAHNTEAAIDRLAALPDPPAAVDELLSANPRVGVDQGVYYGTAYAPMQALARHAARTGGVIDARFHRRIADLAMRAAPGWREKCLREIVASIDPAVRDEVLLARDDWPGWARLRLVTPERGAPLVVEMILGWPKGIYTQLCKQHGAKFNLPHGRTAKQFWENAALTLRSFGAAAVEPVRAASETPGPHRKFFRDTLAALTTD